MEIKLYEHKIYPGKLHNLSDFLFTQLIQRLVLIY